MVHFDLSNTELEKNLEKYKKERDWLFRTVTPESKEEEMGNVASLVEDGYVTVTSGIKRGEPPFEYFGYLILWFGMKLITREREIRAADKVRQSEDQKGEWIDIIFDENDIEYFIENHYPKETFAEKEISEVRRHLTLLKGMKLTEFRKYKPKND